MCAALIAEFAVLEVAVLAALISTTATIAWLPCSRSSKQYEYLALHRRLQRFSQIGILERISASNQPRWLDSLASEEDLLSHLAKCELRRRSRKR